MIGPFYPDPALLKLLVPERGSVSRPRHPAPLRRHLPRLRRQGVDLIKLFFAITGSQDYYYQPSLYVPTT